MSAQRQTSLPLLSIGGARRESDHTVYIVHIGGRLDYEHLAITGRHVALDYTSESAHRYSALRKLHETLAALCDMPPFPAPKALFKNSIDVVLERKGKLQRFLDDCVSSATRSLPAHDAIVAFFGIPEVPAERSLPAEGHEVLAELRQELGVPQGNEVLDQLLEETLEQHGPSRIQAALQSEILPPREPTAEEAYRGPEALQELLVRPHVSANGRRSHRERVPCWQDEVLVMATKVGKEEDETEEFMEALQGMPPEEQWEGLLQLRDAWRTDLAVSGDAPC